MGILSIVILTCKSVALACLFISVYAYHWFQIDNYSVNKDLVQDLCISYGAFCNLEDQMPLPRLIVIAPCVFLVISLLLEIINLCLLCPVWSRVPTLLNCFLEQTSVALSFAVTIHCIWVTIVHIRISMEMRIVHLHWTFFAFGLATILIPIDCICSIVRIMNNCQYDENSETNHGIQSYRQELAILTTLIFVLATVILIVMGFVVVASQSHEMIDWSFIIFILSSMLGFTDLICSLVRVVSYCRENSFRSTSITYTVNDNQGAVQIQS
ncbi:unnamed protein product [Rotaria sp. Silwood2]|nr:unnamed protein product [Rotaria sp. Silwood2]